MKDTNYVFLVGRLVRKAEMKYTANGKAVTKFNIAVNKNKKAANEWKNDANFFEVVLWGQLGESLFPYLTKGKQLIVVGELNEERYDQKGENRTKVNVTASSIQLLGGSSNSNQEQGENNPPQEEQGNGGSFADDIPF